MLFVPSFSPIPSQKRDRLRKAWVIKAKAFNFKPSKT